MYTRSGINQNEASTYSIVKFEQANGQPNAIPNEQANTQPDEHIITKLNLLFNYIYKKESGAAIGLSEKDRNCLITILRHLEMYVENTVAYDLMPADRFLDEKIMLWAVKEIYLSPHKVFLNNLKRNRFILRYQKTKKYITGKPDYKLEEIINYFIVCLHDELES